MCDHSTNPTRHKKNGIKNGEWGHKTVNTKRSKYDKNCHKD